MGERGQSRAKGLASQFKQSGQVFSTGFTTEFSTGETV